MRSIIAISVGLLLFVADAYGASSTSANRSQFRWKDAAGTPHYSDMLTPEALQSGYDILNAKGAVVKHVDRQRTPEELFAEEGLGADVATLGRSAHQSVPVLFRFGGSAKRQANSGRV